jgi:hypothetical protein
VPQKRRVRDLQALKTLFAGFTVLKTLFAGFTVLKIPHPALRATFSRREKDFR